MSLKLHPQAFLMRSLLLVTLLSSFFLFPHPALAAPSIASVQPNTVANTNSTELVVTGADFEEGARVVVEHVGALTTTFVSGTVLSALLPAGLLPGVYAITVINPDSTSDTLANALTITAAPTTPEAPVVDPGDRPVIVIDSYNAGGSPLAAGQSATLAIRLKNKGHEDALNVTLVFSPGDIIPMKTGGVISINQIAPEDTRKVNQPFTLSNDAAYKQYATVVVALSYTDVAGTAYSETFNLNIPVKAPSYSAVGTETPTPTATVAPNFRPQLVITDYATDPLQLQPGFQFHLKLKVQNLGKGISQRVNMILGGGTSSGGGAGQGTPDSGGVSGGSSNLTNFAPLNSSNVQFLGDMDIDASRELEVLLIVNTSTQPGAYALPISFTYVGPNGGNFTDDQVITLLVYAPPRLDVNFYRVPDPLFAGQPGQLPLQVVNLGRSTVVLGSMTVSVGDGFLENSTTLIGPLDPGGYFTLDSLLTPNQPGPLELTIQIAYNDDFNQPNVIVKTLPLEVMEAPVYEPEPGSEGSEGEIPVIEPQAENWWQKFVRFLRGLFGLDSAAPTPEPGPLEDVPIEQEKPSLKG